MDGQCLNASWSSHERVAGSTLLSRTNLAAREREGKGQQGGVSLRALEEADEEEGASALVPLLEHVELVLRGGLWRWPAALVRALEGVQALVTLVGRLGLEGVDSAALRRGARAWLAVGWVAGRRHASAARRKRRQSGAERRRRPSTSRTERERGGVGQHTSRRPWQEQQDTVRALSQACPRPALTLRVAADPVKASPPRSGSPPISRSR